MNQKLSSFNQSMLEAIEWQYLDEPVINSWTVRAMEMYFQDLKSMKKNFIGGLIAITVLFGIFSIPLAIVIDTTVGKLTIIIATLFFYIPLVLVMYASIYKAKVFSYRFTNKGFEVAEWSDYYAIICKGASYFLLVIIAALFILMVLNPEAFLPSIGGSAICAIGYAGLFYSGNYASDQTEYRQYKYLWYNFNKAIINRNIGRNMVYICHDPRLKIKVLRKGHGKVQRVFCGEHLEEMLALITEHAPLVQQIEATDLPTYQKPD